METILALDIGGTKIDVCKYSSDYELVSSDLYRTADFKIRSKAFADDVKGLIDSHLDKTVSKIGISWNCVMNRGVVVWSSLLGGYSMYPLQQEIEKAFALPTSTDDDIHAMALAEHRFGKVKEEDHFVVLNMGTGIGAGAFSGGVLRGHSNLAGLNSFMKMYVPEIGASLALENLVSGRGIQELYQRFGGDGKAAGEICDLVNVDERARRAVDVFGRALAEHLLQLTVFYNPRVIVITGSVRKSAPVYLPAVRKIYEGEMRAQAEGERDPRMAGKTQKGASPEAMGMAEIVVSELEHAPCLGVI